MVKSCMMIEEVMYGPTPSIMIDKVESPPPENIFRTPRNWLLFMNEDNLKASIPGIGIAERSLKTRRAARTNNTRDLKDLSVNIILILLKTVSIFI